MTNQLALSLATSAPDLTSALWNGSLVQQNQSVAGWFVGESGAHELNPARQAFDEAVKAFRTEVSPEECDKWLKHPTSIYEVEQAVVSAKEKYDKRAPKSRARRWLSSCSSRLMYYSVIMDTLSQHHPEYVSLAWGAIKFLFIAVLNHEELLTEISKTIAKIADVLPRADLCSNLYPTQRMRTAVAQLYAKIMHFVQDAVKWYKKGKLAHSVSAIFNPYDLGFKAIVEEISKASRKIDQEASAASKAEIRELHIKVQQFAQMSMAYHERHNLALMTVTDQLTQQAAILRQQRTSQLTTISTLSHIPDPENSLKYYRSLKTRRRVRLLIDPSQILKLREWHEDTANFPILIAKGRGVRSVAKDFAVDLLDMLRASGVPAIWALSDTMSEGNSAWSLADILLSLAIQAVTLNSQAMSQAMNISISQLQKDVTEEDAFEFFERCLAGITKLYIVLHIAVLNAAVDDNSTKSSAFIQRLLNVLLKRKEGGIKLVIAVEEFDDVIEIEEQELLEDSYIYVSGQGPGLLRRRAGRGFTKFSSHVMTPLRAGGSWLTEKVTEGADQED